MRTRLTDKPLVLLARNRPAIVATFLLLLTAPTTALADKSWDWPVGGIWSNPAHWSPNAAPAIGDIARLGDLPGITDRLVFLDQDVLISGLEITSGMKLNTEGNRMTVLGDAVVSGNAGVVAPHHLSTLRIQDGPNLTDFRADNLSAHSDGRVWLDGGGLWIDERLVIGVGESSFGGHGEVLLTGAGTVLRNSGPIVAVDGDLIFNATGGGILDLDGFSGTGRLVASKGRSLVFDGGHLHAADDFSGQIVIRENATLDMNLDLPWVADASSEISFTTFNPSPGEIMRLTGADMTVKGLMQVDEQGYAKIQADTTIDAIATVDVGLAATLWFDYATIVNGGDFSVGQDAKLLFGLTHYLHGGTFNTPSDNPNDGVVDFFGATVWDGEVTINGVARVMFDGIVDGHTVINANRLDMDGDYAANGYNSEWEINASLVVNAEKIDTGNGNVFNGQMDIDGGFAGRVTINLTDPSDYWTMAGEMNLLGHDQFFRHRVAGARMDVTGQLNVEQHVVVTSDLNFRDGPEATLATVDDRLRLAGKTYVESGTLFLGEGELQNLTGAYLTLADGVSTDDVGLVNYGVLGNRPRRRQRYGRPFLKTDFSAPWRSILVAICWVKSSTT